MRKERITVDNKILKKVLKQCLFFLVILCVGSICYTYRIKGREQSYLTTDEEKKWDRKMSEQEELLYTDTLDSKEDIMEQIGEKYIKIAKHQGDLLPVNLKDLYQTRQVKLTIYHLMKESISSEDIYKVVDGREQEEGDSALKELRENTNITFFEDSGKWYSAEILLPMDDIYGYRIYEDEQFIYIECCRPKEVYDYILVVDAGHGGKDTGTPPISGIWEEKDYNLDFVQKIEENWDMENSKLYLTRWEDSQISLSSRVAFANKVEADWFVSVHCNGTDEYEGTGLEALYKTNAFKKQSKEMAQLCMEELEKETGFFNRGLLDGQSIYIVREAKMPMILLEMGFLSDRENLSYMKKEANRDKMAKAVCKALKEGMETIK